jgi:hypothetical protein
VQPTRLPPYSVTNDGTGPYAIFTCESCGRDYRAQPVFVEEVKETIAKSALGGFLRNIPIVGGAAANQVEGDRYRNTLTKDELDKAWADVKVNFAECQSCRKVVCIPDFDVPSGYCREDSPRSEELEVHEAQQAGAAAASFFAGVAGALGVTEAVKAGAAQAVVAAPAATTCASCGTALAPGARFCPSCGTAVAAKAFCAACGTELAAGAKFCANCGKPA